MNAQPAWQVREDAMMRRASLEGLAARMRQAEAEPDVILAALNAANASNNQNFPGAPLPAEDVQAIVASGLGSLPETTLPPFDHDAGVLLPSDHYAFIEAAQRLFPKFAERHMLFVRGDRIVELDDAVAKAITAEQFCSRIERLGPTWRHATSRGGIILREARCPTDTAAKLLATREALQLLPPLRLITRAPVLTEVKGELRLLGPGYNPEAGGVLVTGPSAPEGLSLEDARAALLDLLSEYAFVGEGDRARAVAALITPALAMGRFLRDRVPMDVRQADDSQAGKTLMQTAIRTIYDETAYLIAQRSGGGVGSFHESLSAALISGRPFVVFDNWRGAIDSPSLEAVITAPGPVACRIPFRGEVHIDPRGTLFQLTSNGVEVTADLANRCSIVRIKKQRGVEFRPLLDLVRDRQPFYLGAVHAVVREWHRQGKPTLRGVDHDFREWAGVLGWIVREVFGLGDLMAGHREIQGHVGDPSMVWFRKLVLAAKDAGLADGAAHLSASRLFELCQERGLDLPGAKVETLDETSGAKRVGVLLSRAFGKRDALDVDGIPVERLEMPDEDGRARKRYVMGEQPPCGKF